MNRECQQRIEQIAKKVWTDAVSYYDDPTLKSLCLDVSRDLIVELKKNDITNCELIRGTFHLDNPDESQYDEQYTDDEWYDIISNPLHYWVRVENIIIDLTLKQFQDECEDQFDDIFIGKVKELGRHKFKAIHD